MKIVAIVFGSLLAVAALLVLLSVRIVSPGVRGVVVRLGAVQPVVLNEGLHFVAPVITSVKKMNVKTLKHQVIAPAFSKDIQQVDSDIALNYHINAETCNVLYQKIGKDYQATIIDPAIQESVKAVTATFTAQQLIEERHKVGGLIKAQLTERLGRHNIIVDEFSIVNFDFSSDYEKAVEMKQIAQQSALKAQNDLVRIETEAKQRIAVATAEAEAIKIQAQSISAQGGAEYVNLKAVEKWNGVLPVYVTSGSPIPFLNINK